MVGKQCYNNMLFRIESVGVQPSQLEIVLIDKVIQTLYLRNV